MARKFLDDNGVLYFWNKIKTYIGSVVPTKQSDLTNDDYTVKDQDYSTYKNKIDQIDQKVDNIITTGGEPNVIEGVTVNGTDTTITNKKAIIAIATGNSNGNISVNGTDIPVKGLGSAAYASTTDFDQFGAAASVVGTQLDPAGTVTVYGALAAAEAAQDGVDAINAAGYQTASDVDAAIQDAIGDISGISYEVVGTLPQNGEAGVIYLKPNGGSNPNIYEEYIYVNGAYEKIGTTDVDLSNYMQTTDMVSITNAEIDVITNTSGS